MSEPRSFPGLRRLAGSGLVVLVLASLVLVAVPVWLIRPFVAQTPDALAVAFWLRRLAPAVTLCAVAAATLCAAVLWRRARWRSRALIVLAFLPLLGTAWQARQSLFERMFTPLPSPRFAAAAEAGWVGKDEPVLAVTLNGDSAAYPVRQVAYHHIVQDVVGGVPVAVTY